MFQTEKDMDSQIQKTIERLLEAQDAYDSAIEGLDAGLRNDIGLAAQCVNSLFDEGIREVVIGEGDKAHFVNIVGYAEANVALLKWQWGEETRRMFCVEVLLTHADTGVEHFVKVIGYPETEDDFLYDEHEIIVVGSGDAREAVTILGQNAKAMILGYNEPTTRH